MEELTARFVDPLVGMGAKEVALGLQKIRRETFRSIPVEEGKRRGEGRRRYAELNRMHERMTPGSLVVVQNVPEEVVKQEILESGLRS